jgi:MinD-like ATPase involved in chromosome partitioning or flagellar assembly
MQPPGKDIVATTAAIPNTEPASRIVFTQGGKGGVGKTAFASLLVEWYSDQNTPCIVLDMDTENKARGSLAHFFPAARKINMHAPDGLDAFVDVLEEGTPIVVADMGSGGGAPVHKWFGTMFTSVAELGVVFTAIGIVTPDPASVESVLSWAAALQNRVQYLIVKNAILDPADFTYWENDPTAQEFRRKFKPGEIMMEYRFPKVEHPARQHGVTLGCVANRAHTVPDLNKTTVVLRAQAYRRNLFAELDRVKDLLLL